MALNAQLERVEGASALLDELTLSGYGLQFNVADAADTGVCERLKKAFPPEFVNLSEPAPPLLN